MPEKIVLGFVGPMGAGKGASCAYLHEHHGVATVRYSSMLRDILTRLYLPHTRDNMIKISEAIREAFGDDIMARTVLAEIREHVASIVCVDGIRRMKDIDVLRKELPGFRLAYIDAAMETRYARITRRGENADDAAKTYEQFVAEHARSTEQTIAQVANTADVRIDNNGTREQLYKQLDALLV